jgi:hypothetical protein
MKKKNTKNTNKQTRTDASNSTRQESRSESEPTLIWRHLIDHMKTRACKLVLVAPGQERDLNINELEMILYYITPNFFSEFHQGADPHVYITTQIGAYNFTRNEIR